MHTLLPRNLAAMTTGLVLVIGLSLCGGARVAEAIAPSTVCDTMVDHPQQVIDGLATRLQTRCFTNANRVPVMQAQHGIARVVAGDWIEYTPNPGYRGPDTLVAILEINGVLTRFRDFFPVEVIGTAQAAADTYSVHPGEPLVVGVDAGLLANDELPTAGWLIQQGTTPPAHGTLTLDTVTGAFTYVPDDAWPGRDRFLYRLTGPDAGSYSSIVEVTFTGD